MQTKQLIWTAAAALLLGNSAFAQAHVEALSLLKEVRVKTEAYTDQTIAFTNTLDAPGRNGGARVKRSSKGTVTVVGTNYRLDWNGQTIFVNNAKAYIVSPDDEEVTVRPLGKDGSAFSPSSLLAKYETGSNFAWAGTATVKGKTIKYVRMKPKASEEVREIVIGIDVSTKRLYSYQEFGLNDVITTITVDTYAVNGGVSKAKVLFNRANYPGYTVVEPKSK
jgi:hypothetical protein